MTFRFTEQHVHEYHRDGLTVFRGLIPQSLITDLRRVSDDGRRLAREKKGENAQRIQPVKDFDLDQKPFADYASLPDFREAIDKLLSPRHNVSSPMLGILLEPGADSYSTDWHRDARRFLDDQEWQWVTHDMELGSQINCALYEDTCTWFVPGSHKRGDIPGEKAVGLKPKLDGLNEIDREMACLAYTRSMPNAVQLHLFPGDMAIYRPWAWHIGYYTPYKRRATLHDAAGTPRAEAWWLERWLKQKKIPYYRDILAVNSEADLAAAEPARA